MNNKEELFKDYYILADFDRTITKSSSKTSWSILAESGLLDENYVKARKELYNYYRPIEIDSNISDEEKSKYMMEWYIKHINEIVKCKITKQIFYKASQTREIMEFRKGASEFLKEMHDMKVPIIIISAGIGNFIEEFLKNNNCYYDNIHIVSNMIIFDENEIAISVKDNIIHSLNKNITVFSADILKKICNRNKILLLGDQISDLKMAEGKHKNELITVCFHSEELLSEIQSIFDIVIYENEDYFDLQKKLLKKLDDKNKILIN